MPTGGASAAAAARAPQGADGEVPTVSTDPRWTLVLEESGRLDRDAMDAHDSLLTVADGTIGVRGVREDDGEARQLVVTAGIYDDREENPLLLHGPIASSLVTLPVEGATERRVLDLRTGVLIRERLAAGRELRSTRFVSLARPGTFAMRAVGPSSWVAAGQTLRLPDAAPRSSQGDAGDGRRWAQTQGLRKGGITAAAATEVRREGPLRTIDRIAAYVTDPRRAPDVDRALAALEEARACGFDELLHEQRAAMAERWHDADLSIGGDDRLTLAARYAVFHLLTSVPETGEAAVGARGLSGDAYGGHVLWDADMYVLPVLAAIRPAAARAMLEYRIRRLPAARRNARALACKGARFPWESGRDGTDVTPRMVRRSGQIIPILTGQHEEHITADVAWAAWEYAAWTGDWAFLDGPGRPLVIDTARYWASRVRIDRAGRGHLYGVVGPDEYHEIVDDDAFTNVMARWNLRRAAQLVTGRGGRALAAEAAEWERLAAALVDGYDERTCRHEQCAGFWTLDPFVVSEHHPVPLMADEVLGRRRVQTAQVIKQPDVLMLHHVVPEEMPPGSLLADLDFYGPRTAHGSSLSPAVHASVMARAGRPDDAVELFRMACELDLGDTTGTTARGLHTATAGGVWQALAWGFAGLRPERGALRVDPRLPRGWDSIDVTVRFHGNRVHLTIDHERIGVEVDAPVTLRLPDGGLTEVPASGGSYPCPDGHGGSRHAPARDAEARR